MVKSSINTVLQRQTHGLLGVYVPAELILIKPPVSRVASGLDITSPTRIWETTE